MANTGVVRAVFPGVQLSPIDWNYNGKIDSPPPLDINNNGTKNDSGTFFTLPTDNTYNGDWNYINQIHGMQQIGLGRNFLFLSVGIGPKDLLHLSETDLSVEDPATDAADNGEIDSQTASDDAPQALNVTGLTAQSVTLSWQAPRTENTNPVTGYTIYRATDSILIAPLKTSTPSPATATTFTDNQVQSGKTFTYVVTASYSDGPTSGPSNPITITTP